MLFRRRKSPLARPRPRGPDDVGELEHKDRTGYSTAGGRKGPAPDRLGRRSDCCRSCGGELCPGGNFIRGSGHERMRSPDRTWTSWRCTRPFTSRARRLRPRQWMAPMMCMLLPALPSVRPRSWRQWRYRRVPRLSHSLSRGTIARWRRSRALRRRVTTASRPAASARVAGAGSRGIQPGSTRRCGVVPARRRGGHRFGVRAHRRASGLPRLAARVPRCIWVRGRRRIRILVTAPMLM